MKTVFVATAILTASFSAFGEGERYANPHAGDSGLTRAQVLQEAAGPIVSGELGYSHEAPSSTALSRGSAAGRYRQRHPGPVCRPERRR